MRRVSQQTSNLWEAVKVSPYLPLLPTLPYSAESFCIGTSNFVTSQNITESQILQNKSRFPANWMSRLSFRARCHRRKLYTIAKWCLSVRDREKEIDKGDGQMTRMGEGVCGGYLERIPKHSG